MEKGAVGRFVQALIGILLLFSIVFGLRLSAFAQDWPACGSSGCVASDLVVNRVFIDAQPCAGATRTGVLKADLSASSTRYNIRITAQVYVVASGAPGYLKTIDYCWPGAFTGTQTVTLDSSVLWDCDASLELRYTLVSWQILSGAFTCGSVLPCGDITPKCNGDYFSQQISVEGSEPPNAAPTGSNSAVSTSEDTRFTFAVDDFGYSDSDGDPLSQIRITSLESIGSLKLGGVDVTLNQVITVSQLSSGFLTYDPLPGQNGTPYDSFRFEVHDGTEYSASSYQMTINVNAVNDPPIAVDDDAMAPRSIPVLIPVLLNDLDPEGGPITIASVAEPLHGSAAIVEGGIRYAPDFFYLGLDAFVYTIQDPQGLQASATVTLEVGSNAPPSARANGPYAALVGDPVLLDATFSNDPDIFDNLQYRWDVNGNGTWDTDWQDGMVVDFVYAFPYRGPIYLEVRDLYYGVPNGTSDLASSFATILPRPTQIAISIYVDLNGDGEFGEGDVGLPGVEIVFDDGTILTSDENGTILADVEPGAHLIRISDAGVSYLQERGFFLSEEALASIEIESGEWIALFFNPEARGFLEVDLGAQEQQGTDNDN